MGFVKISKESWNVIPACFHKSCVSAFTDFLFNVPSKGRTNFFFILLSVFYRVE
jgi:hypothetical protein